MSSSKKKKKPSILSRLFYSQPSLWLVGHLARGFTSLLFSTLRVKITGADLLVQASSNKLIIALWHDKLLLAPLIRRTLKTHPLAVAVSNSRDGKLLASFVKTFTKTTPIYVAHNVRHGALLQMVEALEQGKALIITPDGPRGPRHVAKPGIFFTQEKTQAQIVAMHWQASSYWQLGSWDKMQIPKPFAELRITFFEVAYNANDDLESKLSGHPKQ